VPQVGATSLPDNAFLKRRCGHRRSGDRYYVRVSVPSDLQEVLRKRTIEQALNTGDLVEARRRKHAVVAAIFADFERARLGSITSADIEQEAQRYLRERLARIEADPGDAFESVEDDEGTQTGLVGQSALWTLQDALTEQDWPPTVRKEAEEVARRYGATLTVAQKNELCAVLTKAEIEALDRALAIRRGRVPVPVGVLNTRAVDPIAGTVPPPSQLPTRHGDGPRISKAAENYFADRNRQKRGAWTGQTLNQSRATLRLFIDFTRDAPLSSVTRTDVGKFLSVIAGLDPHYGRSLEFKKLTLSQIAKKHTAPCGGGLSNKTLNRHAATLAGLFEWAIRAGKFEGNNPAKGHHRTDNDHEVVTDGSARRSFTTDELNKLFAGPIFQVPREDCTAPKQHSIGVTLSWLIPIALFSGMRLDEMCGLRTEDVKQDEGILYFDLQSYEGRRLKTPAATRRVPVHSELLRIGFDAYIGHVLLHQEPYLFPALKPGGPDGKRSWYASKRFLAYRCSVGVTARGTVFHCLRKNAATALERAHVPENEAAQLIGHQLGTMTYGLYSGGLDLAGLKKVVEAINYPGLQLTHLYEPHC
jgi:integrase